MAVTNIKISELNNFPTAVAENDFFPLVDSSSMTTYRIDVAALANALTQSMNVSRSIFATSASYASRSLSASHALLADNVSLTGSSYTYPFWKGVAANGNLDQGSTYYNSPLYVTFSGLAYPGVMVIDRFNSFYQGYTPNPNRPDYVAGGWWKYKNNSYDGNGLYAASGLFTSWPIISTNFVGTDRVQWYWSTGSGHPPQNYYLTSFWSGSSRTGFWADITQSSGPTSAGVGAISQSFNGKWVRIAASSYFGGSGTSSLIASHSAYGEMAGGGNFSGRIRLLLATTLYNGGSNTNQWIDMAIHDGMWGGGISAQVLHASQYAYDHIRKLRLSIWSAATASNPDKLWDDPMYALDIFVDYLKAEDTILTLKCESWGGLRFLDTPNVDPIPLIDTASFWGHTDPKTATYLEFPAAPGYYSTLGTYQPYYFQGKRVQINPNRNETTESAWFYQPNINYKPYSLWVSGTISTQQYYCNDSAGQSGQFKSYSPANGWMLYTHEGGILVASSSTTAPTSVIGTPDAALSASYASHSRYSETASYVDPAMNPGIPVAWAVCVSTSSYTANPHTPGIDWHWMDIKTSYNVRGVTKKAGAGSVDPDFPDACDDTSGPVSQRTLANPYQGSGPTKHWLVTLNRSMSNTNYFVQGGGGGSNSGNPGQYCNMTMFPESKRTTTQFTLSMCEGNMDWSGTNPNANEICWFTFAVYENPYNLGVPTNGRGWPA